jgi:hypothetical protein
MSTQAKPGEAYNSRISRVVGAFTRGLAQMAGGGRASTPKLYQPRSDSEALMADWEKVGSDLGRAMRMEREEV